MVLPILGLGLLLIVALGMVLAYLAFISIIQSPIFVIGGVLILALWAINTFKVLKPLKQFLTGK